MRLPVRLPFFVAFLLATAAAARFAPGELLCSFQDPRIRESSGLAVPAGSDGYFFTHNDSGYAPELFAVDLRGRTQATLTVAGARNVDWEDMARGPGPFGESCLYLGDIGDNLARRDQIAVYVIPEPEIDPSRVNARASTAEARRYDFVYEDRPQDAEALLVHPRSGRLYVVTKSPVGSGVYAAPETLREGERLRLRRVAFVTFTGLPATITRRRDHIMRLLVTGGDFSPDGRRLVLRTYTDAYEWLVDGDGPTAATFERPPLHVPLPPTAQGEAITYLRDGGGLLVSTEGERAPVHRLRVLPRGS